MNWKNAYVSAEIEIILMSNGDIITTSGENPFDKVITDEEYWD